jgi:hypothetical protein
MIDVGFKHAASRLVVCALLVFVRAGDRSRFEGGTVCGPIRGGRVPSLVEKENGVTSC